MPKFFRKPDFLATPKKRSQKKQWVRLFNIDDMYLTWLFFYCGKTFNLFIINRDSTINTRNYKKYIQMHRSPSDNYNH